MSACILCGEKATINVQDNASRTIYNCQNCGVFVVSDLIVTQVKTYQCELAAYFTSRKLAGRSEVVLVSFDKLKRDKDYLQLTVEQILEQYPQSFSERMDMVLKNLSWMSSYEGEEIRVDGLHMFPMFYTKKANYDAMSFMIKSMQKLELLEVNYYGSAFFPCGVIVSPKGWDRLSLMQEGGVDGDTVLILYSGKGDEHSEAFRATAGKAAEECGCSVVERRIAGAKIDNEMIALIRESRLIITDLSDSAGAAYYAVGMTTALGKANILTCHRGVHRRLEVDTEQIVVLGWKDEDELYLQVLNAIRAEGPVAVEQ